MISVTAVRGHITSLTNSNNHIEDSHVTVTWLLGILHTGGQVTSDWPFQKCSSFMLICVCQAAWITVCCFIRQCSRRTCQQGSYGCHSIGKLEDYLR